MTPNLGITPEKLADLAAEFPREAVHWRAQSITERDGKHKALALAYLDARNVMERLDSVCGAENWQDRYEETIKGRVICALAININGEWVTKADGAGATDVEADKGAISDALKRAAVKWGIGRYLYGLPNIWVPCEVGNNGKFRKFTDDPWKHVPESFAAFISDDQHDLITLLAQGAGVTLQTICDGYNIPDLRKLPAHRFAALKQRLQTPVQERKAA
jgi:hypothetical protein